MRRGRIGLTVAALVVAAACAPAPPPVLPDGPRYPEFVFPEVPPDVAASSAAVDQHRRAWGFLQAGDLRTAQRGFSDALRRAPGFFPAEAGLGYVELAARDYPGAVDRFDRALSLADSYVPALIGRGEALLAWDRPEEALSSFETAVRLDPSLTEIGRRVELLRFRHLQDQVARAREATGGGRLAEAREAYGRAIESSPESGFLYRELATVERRLGENARALAHARRALELDPGDVDALVLIGDIEHARGNIDAALSTWERAYERSGDAELGRRIDALRQRIELDRLPAAYRAISGSSGIRRGDLAALVGVRLRELVDAAPRSGAVLLTDTRGHWAEPWISAVARARIVDAFPNHTFQPDAPVRRGDLAQAVSRLLQLVAARAPELASGWQNARPQVRDVPPGHLQYSAVALAVGAGVLPLREDGRFELAQAVSGADALAAIRRIEALLGR